MKRLFLFALELSSGVMLSFFVWAVNIHDAERKVHQWLSLDASAKKGEWWEYEDREDRRLHSIHEIKTLEDVLKHMPVIEDEDLQHRN